VTVSDAEIRWNNKQAFIYGILYLVFVSYPIAFREVRHWSLGTSALPYIGMMIGILIGCAIVVTHTRHSFAKATQANGGVVIPEQRLPLMIAGGCLLPVGLFIFAWTSDPKIHWAGMVIGSAPVGTGMYMVFVQCLNYLVDVYPTIANSAIGANTFVRSFFGAGFPLFAPFMYHNLGVAWATSTLGFISIAMIPIPVLFYRYGHRIRSWSKNSKHT
jgi:DHA1 family multidrug resistance protein-like MFS transporter